MFLEIGVVKKQNKKTKTKKHKKLSTLLQHDQGPHNRQKFSCAYVLISKSAAIKYHQLLLKLTNVDGKSCFDQLATASFSTPP